MVFTIVFVFLTLSYIVASTDSPYTRCKIVLYYYSCCFFNPFVHDSIHGRAIPTQDRQTVDITNTGHVQGLLFLVFVMSRVCYVQGLLCQGFAMSRVYYVQGLRCLGFVMSRVCLLRVGYGTNSIDELLGRFEYHETSL